MRTHETIQHTSLNLAIAYHGLSARISSIRQSLAGSTMERMDHKDALYGDLGALALTGCRTESQTATGGPAMPRTFIERYHDKKLDKRVQDHQCSKIDAYRKEKIFGTQKSMLGKTAAQKHQEKQIVSRAHGKGEITAHDSRILRNKIAAQPMRLGEETHKTVTKRYNKTIRRLNRTLNQRISKQWRTYRKNKAKDRIITNHIKEEFHRKKIKELKTKT